LQSEYDAEQDGQGRKGFKGKRFLEVGMLREVVRLRGRGVERRDIERRFGLRKGVLEELGRDGIVDVVGGR
jgi:hypothetical protein